MIWDVFMWEAAEGCVLRERNGGKLLSRLRLTLDWDVRRRSSGLHCLSELYDCLSLSYSGVETCSFLRTGASFLFIAKGGTAVQFLNLLRAVNCLKICNELGLPGTSWDFLWSGGEDLLACNSSEHIRRAEMSCERLSCGDVGVGMSWGEGDACHTCRERSFWPDQGAVRDEGLARHPLVPSFTKSSCHTDHRWLDISVWPATGRGFWINYLFEG